MRPLLVFALAAAVLLAGCATNTPPPNSVACGNDLSCFKTQVQQSCGPATVTLSQHGVTVNGEVSLRADGACNIRIQLIDIVPPAGASDREKAEIDSARPLFPFANMDCRVLKSDAAQLDNPAFLSQPATLQNCEGVLKDQIQQRFSAYFSPSPTP